MKAFIFLLAFVPSALQAASIQLTVQDAPGTGFNDPFPVAPLPGNNGTTLGAQRRNAMQAAANVWASKLESAVVIRMAVKMEPLTCSPESGLLGAASPTSVFRDFPGAPRANTWFVSALANARAGQDLNPSADDIFAHFNSDVDENPNCLSSTSGWWYGIGQAAPPNQIDFFATVLHEIGHGLGFLSLVDLDTGEKFQGKDDAFMANLEDHSLSLVWPSLTNGQRAISATDTGDLHWIGTLSVAAGGALAQGRHPGGHLRMYAPDPTEPGSSVSHWDTVLSPDELMEPLATPNQVDIVTTPLLRDIGWQVQAASGPCVRDATTACLVGNRFEVQVDYQNAQSSGQAQVMSFNGQRAENDESAFLFFTSATNFEMGLKILNACGLNGKFWVFIGGLTNQGWTVHVRDTQTGATKTYSNTNGNLTATVADTAALNCP